MKNITKNQTKEQFLNTILSNAKIDYKHFLKMATKKDFVNFVKKIHYTTRDNQIDIVYVNKDVLNDAKKFIYFDTSKISNSELKKIINFSFVEAISGGLDKMEQTKEQITYFWCGNTSIYKFFKNLNLSVYFIDKVVEYNRVTKQYQTRNITK